MLKYLKVQSRGHKTSLLVGGCLVGKPVPFYCFFSFLMLLKWADTAREGQEGVRASFTVHCFGEVSCGSDWQRCQSPARG